MHTHKRLSNLVQSLQLRVGDWLIVGLSGLLIFFLIVHFWQIAPASKVQIRLGNKIVGTYSLNQQREIHVHGALGESTILIQHGQARFTKSPCTGQYCVHQGWLKRGGQIAICLPNQVSLALIGDQQPYDSLNY